MTSSRVCQSAASSLSSLCGSRQQLKDEGSELIDFFCEDRDTFRSDDCFSVFHTFCSRFTDAVKENVEREVKEAARRRQLQELEEQKRRLWAGDEEVDRGFRWHCRSQKDMSVSTLQHEGMLTELLTPKSHLNDSLGPLGRSGSLQRSRKSPSSSPSIAAEHELSMLLEMLTPDHKLAQQRGEGAFRSSSAKPSSQNQEVAPQTPWSPPKMCQSQRGAAFSHQGIVTSHLQTALRGKPGSTKKDVRAQSDDKTTGNMSVVLETCSLVPELKVFDKFAALNSRNERRLTRCHHDDVVVTDLEEEGEDKSRVKEPQRNSSSSQRDKDEEMVVVWCVTDVCEAAGKVTHADNTHVQTEEDQSPSSTDRGNQQTSSVQPNHTPGPQRANKKPVPVPISSQPVSHCDVPSFQDSLSLTPGWRPAEPAIANEAPAHTTDALKEAKEPTNHGGDRGEGSTNDRRDVETFPEQLADDRGGSNATSCHMTNDSTDSNNGNAESATSFRLSTKNAATSKTCHAAIQPNATTNATNKSKPIRTLTTSENQGMRRVVPISRNDRTATSLGNRPKKPSDQLRSSSTATPASLTVSNLNSPSFRRGERPSTAASSRLSSFHKTQDAKDSRDQKVSGPQTSREQNHNVQRKRPVRKSSTKPQQEEKMCRSTLRALGQTGRGSVSAPATPLHHTTAPSSLLPGFARSTASSSFRRTHTPTVRLPLPHSTHTGSDSSHISSPKANTPSSITPPPNNASSPSTRTGSTRVSTRSSDLLDSSSFLLRTSLSMRASPHSLLHHSLTPPKGQRRNDSGSFSDKSSHSRDSVKTARPSWR